MFEKDNERIAALEELQDDRPKLSKRQRAGEVKYRKKTRKKAVQPGGIRQRRNRHWQW